MRISSAQEIVSCRVSDWEATENMKKNQKFLSRTSAQTLVEYALILFVVAITVIVALAFLGQKASDTMGDTGNSLFSLPPESGPAVHVSSIELELRIDENQVTVRGAVSVSDQEGQAVEGATVRFDWFINGVLAKTHSHRTDRGGIARCGGIKRSTDELSSGDVVKLVVAEVVMNGYSYDSDDNVESSDQVVIP